MRTHRRPSRPRNLRLALAGGLAVLLSAGAASAVAVPITVPRIVTNNGYQVRAEGSITSPAAASSCTALVRAQLQVADGYGGYRVVRALGRHRINVCRYELPGGASGGGVYVWWSGMRYLRSQQARLCWSATQMINGVPSTHVSCKRFYLRGGS